MNPKEQAEIIVQSIYDDLFWSGLTPKPEGKTLREVAIHLGGKRVEMLIEANPTTVEYIGDKVDPLLYEKKITCNKSHYKEVLKAIKNME